MSNNTRTPGPWAIDLRKDNGMRGPAELTVIHGPRGKSDWVADVGLFHSGCRGGSAANARLIAAAPDLLAALEMVRDADNDCRSDGLATIPDMARRTIDAAIAKATGSTQ